MTYKFRGVCPVINVPFFPDERIDYDSLAREIDFTIAQRVESICVFAFNSEPHKMTTDEKKQVIRFFLETVNKRVETLVGLIENSISGVIELGLTAKEYGADGVILYPPALSTPADANLLNYFKTIADAVDLDVMIQDNPRSTGVNMSLPFLLDAFHNIEKFRYLKVECPIPIRKMKKIVEETKGELKCYSGNGGIFAVDAFLNGAWGIMPGAVMAGKFVELYQLLANGETDKARSIFEKILPFTWFEDQSLEFYVSCEKYLLKKQGVIANDTCRAPLCALSDQEKEELVTLFQRI
ncbi:MAG: dihydrodipicolinate synthase family protein [Clostridia bacterium]|nr:dihydrodipicolinate synthase family protein [Clostridia bacterium]